MAADFACGERVEGISNDHNDRIDVPLNFHFAIRHYSSVRLGIGSLQDFTGNLMPKRHLAVF